MKNNKRKLLPYEKALFGLKVLIACAGLFFLILYWIDFSSWALRAGWVCISAEQIVNCFNRWEERTKWNIIGICVSGVFLVLFVCMLVQSLL